MELPRQHLTCCPISFVYSLAANVGPFNARRRAQRQCGEGIRYRVVPVETTVVNGRLVATREIQFLQIMNLKLMLALQMKPQYLTLTHAACSQTRLLRVPIVCLMGPRCHFVHVKGP